MFFFPSSDGLINTKAHNQIQFMNYCLKWINEAISEIKNGKIQGLYLLLNFFAEKRKKLAGDLGDENKAQCYGSRDSGSFA